MHPSCVRKRNGCVMFTVNGNLDLVSYRWKKKASISGLDMTNNFSRYRVNLWNHSMYRDAFADFPIEQQLKCLHDRNLIFFSSFFRNHDVFLETLHLKSGLWDGLTVSPCTLTVTSLVQHNVVASPSL